MKKNLASSSTNLGTFPSPGAPDYRERSLVAQKGWSSERVPPPANSSRRLIGAAQSTPFDSGRTLPSKWEDAERWICSPNSGYGFGKELYSQQSQRRPKSKSGPLGPPGFSSNSTPATPVPEGGSMTNFVVRSPFSTGVMIPGRVLVHSGAGSGGGGEREVGRSGRKVPEWTDLISENSLSSSQDEKQHGLKNMDTMNSPAISRRDMATQMSPESSSTCSSTNGRFSFCPSPPSLETRSNKPGELEQVRDVQVDKRTTVIGWSRNGARIIKNGRGNKEDTDSDTVDTRSSSWDISIASKEISKLQREEAKITAWENLQKAKAEAAMRKLEMKLEKKRSSNTDKILMKLKKAQIKAQEKRSSLSTTTISEENEVPKSPPPCRIFSFRRHVQFGHLRGCFS